MYVNKEVFVVTSPFSVKFALQSDVQKLGSFFHGNMPTLEKLSETKKYGKKFFLNVPCICRDGKARNFLLRLEKFQADYYEKFALF